MSVGNAEAGTGPKLVTACAGANVTKCVAAVANRDYGVISPQTAVAPVSCNRSASFSRGDRLVVRCTTAALSWSRSRIGGCFRARDEGARAPVPADPRGGGLVRRHARRRCRSLPAGRRIGTPRSGFTRGSGRPRIPRRRSSTTSTACAGISPASSTASRSCGGSASRSSPSTIAASARATATCRARASVYEDARVGWQWLVEHEPDPSRRYIYGHSLGGAVAIDLAARFPARRSARAD